MVHPSAAMSTAELVGLVRWLAEEVAWESSDAGRPDPTVRSVAPTPAGVGMFVAKGEDLHNLLDPLAARLSAAGVSATIGNHVEAVPPLPGGG
jgi:hypothetical protein